MADNPAWLSEIPDTVECWCGQKVYRYRDGTKRNLDMTPHKHTKREPDKRTTEQQHGASKVQ